MGNLFVKPFGFATITYLQEQVLEIVFGSLFLIIKSLLYLKWNL